VLLTVIVLFTMLAVLAAVERLRPVRVFEEVPGWRLKCLAFIPIIAGLAASIPYLMAGLIESFKLLPGDRLGIVGGALVGIVVSDRARKLAQRMFRSATSRLQRERGGPELTARHVLADPARDLVNLGVDPGGPPRLLRRALGAE
jgi:hypothetical protein